MLTTTIEPIRNTIFNDTKNGSSFESLPAEIRNLIYEEYIAISGPSYQNRHLLCEDDELRGEWPSMNITNFGSLSLLFTSSTIFGELLGLFYSKVCIYSLTVKMHNSRIRKDICPNTTSIKPYDCNDSASSARWQNLQIYVSHVEILFSDTAMKSCLGSWRYSPWSSPIVALVNHVYGFESLRKLDICLFPAQDTCNAIGTCKPALSWTTFYWLFPTRCLVKQDVICAVRIFCSQCNEVTREVFPMKSRYTGIFTGCPF